MTILHTLQQNANDNLIGFYLKNKRDTASMFSKTITTSLV